MKMDLSLENGGWGYYFIVLDIIYTYLSHVTYR